jgi:hypothetical protein
MAMYNLRNTTTVNCTYLLAWPSVEDNQKSAALCLHTAAGSSSHTPAAAYSLNLQPGKDQTDGEAQQNLQPGKDLAAADAAKLNLQSNQEQADGEAQLNLQPGKDQAAADFAKLNLQPDQEEVASVSTWNAA